MADGVMTTAQVARRLHCTSRTVQRMVADGRLNPVDKFPGYNGGFLFDEHHVEQLAEAEAGDEDQERAS